jgi:transcriptional regulator with XRE-family HTH domain
METGRKPHEERAREPAKTRRGRGTSKPVSETFQERLVAARTTRGWSQERLAAILDEVYGYPIHPTALSRIEKGTRKVTIDDLIAISAALDVAPVHLLFPIEGEDPVALTPRLEVDAEKAIRWARGRQPLDPANVSFYSHQHLGDIGVINPEASPEEKAAALAEYEKQLRGLGIEVVRVPATGEEER